MSTNRWQVGFSVILAAVVGVGAAESKCAYQRYKVSITVLDCKDDRPLEGVQIALFANDSSSEMWRDDEESGPALTDEDGKLSKVYWFDTYSGRGIIYADRCKAKIKSLEVMTIHPDYRIGRFEFKGKDLNPRADGDLIEIVLEPVRLAVLDD